MAEASRRVFLAVWPTPVLAGRLDEISAEAWALCGGRRMRRDTLHITLAFLGEVAESHLSRIGMAMETLAAARFSLSIDTLGYWKHKRIVWAGCRSWPAALDRLVSDIRGALVAAGLPGGEDSAFFPHVTLLRKAGAAEALPTFEAIDWPVAEWVLVESCRSGNGAAYRRLAGWPLT